MTAPAFSSATATTVRFDGREFISFAGCNYLGLAHEPRVIDAARAALTDFGLSTSASRETSGNTRLHVQLEREIASLTGADAALLVPDGYTANLAALQTLAAIGVRTAILDQRAHRSLFDAARTAGLEARTFRSADPVDAQRLIAESPPMSAVVITDGVFAADGRIAPLKALLSSQAFLLVDDCHGLGVLGSDGSGTLTHLGLGLTERITLTSTLAKGIGCAGGFVAGRASFIEVARVKASAYVCTTPSSPILIAAAITALDIARTDHLRRENLARNTAAIKSMLGRLGLESHTDPTPIAAVVVDAAPRMEAIESVLRSQGLFVPLVTYPGGPCPVYFRLSVTSQHTPAQIDRLAAAFSQAIEATSARDALPGASAPADVPGVPSVHAIRRTPVDS